MENSSSMLRASTVLSVSYIHLLQGSLPRRTCRRKELTLGNTEADNGKMPNNPSTSSRIEALRFPLIIGVAFIHSASVLHLANGSFDVQHTNLSWVNFIVYFTQSFVDISVPIFFTISGYLFFKSEWSWGRYIDKLKRRF
jgi:hypothetical protein